MRPFAASLVACCATWLALCAAGCAQRSDPPGAPPEPAALLERDLLRLADPEGAREARLVARASWEGAAELARTYRARRPALFHNLLVRLGLRDRGLCCHWTRDLLDRLDALDLRVYRATWGVAHHGDLLREHSSVVVTGPEQSFEEGIVLDAWRDGGTLAWAPVRADRYPWRPHPEARPGARIDCR